MTREQFWNIPHSGLFYLLATAAVAVFVLGVLHRLSGWRGSTPGHRLSPTRSGIRALFAEALGGRRLLRGDLRAGIMHQCIMWGFLALFLGTILLAIDHYFYRFLRGAPYGLFSFLLDTAGLALIVGTGWALVRRIVIRVPRLDLGPGDTLLLVWLLAVGLSGFCVEASRLAVAPDGERTVSYVGFALASLFPHGPAAPTVHRTVWWVHAVLSLGFIGWLPFGKLFHVLTAPANLYLQQQPFSLEVEEARTSGRLSLESHVAADACTRCGRCVVECPADMAGETFTPRSALQHASLEARAARSPLYRIPFLRGRIEQKIAKAAPGDPVGYPWHCTTCGACAEVCPSRIAPLDYIRELRGLVVEDGRSMPGGVMDALESLYKQNNPWNAPKSKRGRWAKDLGVKDFTKGGRADLLYFVGCTTSFDTRAQEMARSLAAILSLLEVDFGILGKDEPCCGDAARVLGEAGLFGELRTNSLNIFEYYSVRKLFATSPHCFHTLRKEYARSGTDPERMPEVRHYTQLLADYLRDGKLAFSRKIEKTVTFHDPCYLGRHNDVFEEPRSLINAIPGVELREMRHHHRNSLCCGGGGGRMWQEIQGERKISELRIQEAVETGASTLVTACPYCLIMLEDARKTAGVEDRIVVQDLSELVAEALGG